MPLKIRIINILTRRQTKSVMMKTLAMTQRMMRTGMMMRMKTRWMNSGRRIIMIQVLHKHLSLMMNQTCQI
ncbi:hypothetical protein ACS0TY_018821 [Phlomoides rotata]